MQDHYAAESPLQHGRFIRIPMSRFRQWCTSVSSVVHTSVSSAVRRRFVSGAPPFRQQASATRAMEALKFQREALLNS
eukprot:6150260-Pleurochrysis_carterae.AAC.1